MGMRLNPCPVSLRAAKIQSLCTAMVGYPAPRDVIRPGTSIGLTLRLQITYTFDRPDGE